MFAPAMHPALKHAQPARVELKMRTAFNLAGTVGESGESDGAGCRGAFASRGGT